MKKLLYTIALLGLAGLSAQAQQLPQLSFHMFNQQLVNPAFVGSNGSLGFQLTGRQQWTGIEGAPNTYVAAVDAPIGKRSTKPGLAFGLMGYQDEIGVSRINHAQLQLAYRIFFKNSALAFGIQGSATRFIDDYTKLNVADPNDPEANQRITSDILPNTGFGVYYYNSNFYLGVSLAQFSEYSTENLGGYEQARHIFTQGGFNLQVSDDFKLRPSFMAKLNGSENFESPFNAEINLSGIYKDRILLGVGHRINEAVIAMMKLHLTDEFYIGYAYDFNTSVVGANANGSHEVLIGHSSCSCHTHYPGL